MVAVALDPLGHKMRPYRGERLPAKPPRLVAPLVDQLVEDEHAHFVRKVVEVLAVRIVRAADRIVAERLHRLELAANRAPIRGRADEPQVMVVGHGLQEHLASVELHSKSRIQLDRAHAEPHRLAVDLPSFENETHVGRVEIRRIDVPQPRVLDRHLGQGNLLMAELRPRRARLRRRYDVALCILDVGNNIKLRLAAHAAKSVELDRN